MADGATYQVAGVEMARKQDEPIDPAAQNKLSTDEESEKEEIEEIMQARERYGNDRKSKEREWTESFKMYMSWIDTTLNPYLSNLFIPKTHEAVELLSAFLIGNNQSINATPENGSSSPAKALVAARWLEWMWRKVIKARLKVLIWIKQAIVFGNGIMKVGWDVEEKHVWMEARPIEDVYFDYWMPNLQDSEYVIDEIRRSKEDVMNDTKYNLTDHDGNLIRNQVIEGGPDGPGFTATGLFNTYDGTLKNPQCAGKVLCLEVWCKEDNKLKTLLPTSLGWRIARKVDSPNFYKLEGAQKLYFRPFVKLRFKPSPVPNRAYDMGAVYPTIKIQKAFNDLMNEYLDAVVQLGSPMWIKRRGARINPLELVRRPGGIITVANINEDIKKEVFGDIPSSVIEMLNRLDREFEQASMVVNLLKGISQSATATGDALAQQNVQTLLDMIDENLIEALSELGHMCFAIAQENTEGIQSIKMFETDQVIGMLDFKPQDIDGIHDLVIRPDRDTRGPIAIQQKQLLEFINLIRADGPTLAKYPDLLEKIYRRWLENGGIADADFFFQATAQPVENKGPQPAQPKVSISYKDAPSDVQREIEAAAGLQPSKEGQTPTATAPGGPSAPIPGLPSNIKQLYPAAAPAAA